MPQKKRTSSSTPASSINWLAIFSFVALILAGIVGLLAAFKVSIPILSLIKDLLVLAVIAVLAYPVARRNGQVWTIIYWVIVILALIGILVGGIILSL
ncbi:MAG: hypothetical protein FWD49_06610 [Firmicutes bacterium]|nr:hypothetical protein [Bacillota bacterium]